MGLGFKELGKGLPLHMYAQYVCSQESQRGACAQPCRTRVVPCWACMLPCGTISCANLDQPIFLAQAFHSVMLLQHPRPEYLAADLSRIALADVLAKSSFDPGQPAIFLCEGLLYYLDKVRGPTLSFPYKI